MAIVENTEYCQNKGFYRILNSVLKRKNTVREKTYTRIFCPVGKNMIPVNIRKCYICLSYFEFQFFISSPCKPTLDSIK